MEQKMEAGRPRPAHPYPRFFLRLVMEQKMEAGRPRPAHPSPPMFLRGSIL